MKTVSTESFIDKANAIWKAHKNCTYANGWSGQYDSGEYKCDCRGYVMWVLRELGIKITCPGTNYMIRKQMTSVNRVSKEMELRPGMVVFKSRQDISKMPTQYNKGGRDYSSSIGVIDVYHIGIVISTKPLIIRHCSNGGILTDSKLGKWNWAGYVQWVKPTVLNNLDNTDNTSGKVISAISDVDNLSTTQTTQTSDIIDAVSSADIPVGATGVVNITSGHLNLRKKPTTKSIALKYLSAGDEMDIIGQEGNWYKVQVGRTTGFVSKDYVMVC